MKLRFDNERAMAVVGHPDDEMLCAGALARARKDGAAVAICCLCKGDKGQPLEAIADLGAVRKQEMSASAALLEAELYWGEYSDGALSDTYEARMALVEIFRRFRPTIVISHAPCDYHADHRSASSLAEAASWLCASPGQKTSSPALGQAPALWHMDTLAMAGFLPHFYIDVSDYVDLKEAMLACHWSQLERENDECFTSLREAVQMQGRARGLQAGVGAAEAFCTYGAFRRARAW